MDESGGCEDEIQLPEEQRKGLKYFCNICKYGFTTKSNFSRHNRKKHGICTTERPKVPEEIIPKLTFHSTEDFMEWKLKVERDTVANFVAKRGAKSRRNGDIVRYYNCHRSGHYIPRGTGKKPLKLGGSNKIGGNCTASIKTITRNREGGVEISVTFQPIHTGHNPEVRRLALSRPEKEVIAAQLQLGIPMDRILKNIGDNFKPDKRVSFTSRKDLHNIAATYGIDCNRAVDTVDEYLGVEAKDQMEVTELVISHEMSDNVGEIEVSVEKPFEDRRMEVHAHLQHMTAELDHCIHEDEMDLFEALVSEFHLNMEAIRAARSVCLTGDIVDEQSAAEEDNAELGDVVVVAVDSISVSEGTTT